MAGSNHIAHQRRFMGKFQVERPNLHERLQHESIDRHFQQEMVQIDQCQN